MTLHEYFKENWNREPHSLIDHSIRIDLLPDGTFHFYIHPTNNSGTTCDYIVSPGILDGVRERV